VDVWGDCLEPVAVDRLAPQLPVNLDGIRIAAAAGADEGQPERTPPSRREDGAWSRSDSLDLRWREVTRAKTLKLSAVRASTGDSLEYGHADAGYASVGILTQRRSE
jgi:hypothetical protein